MSKVCDDKPMDLDYVLTLYHNEDTDCLLLTMIDIRNAGYPPKENCIVLFNKIMLMYRILVFQNVRKIKKLIKEYHQTNHKNIWKVLCKIKRRNELRKESQKNNHIMIYY